MSEMGGAEDEALPEPHKGMSSEEKGALLLRYASTRKSVEGLDFSGACLVEAAVNSANLAKANLRGANLTRAHIADANLVRANLAEAKFFDAVFTSSNLGGADLEGADLEKAWLLEADLCSANLTEANLREATLRNADLERADLSGANLHGSYLEQANFDGASLSGADLDGAKLSGTQITLGTYNRSGWTPEYLVGLVERGASVSGLQEVLAQAAKPGLTLFVARRLAPGDQGSIQLFATQLLGRTSDVRIAEYTEVGETSSRLRLEGSNPEELIRLAEHITAGRWESVERSTAQAQDSGALVRQDSTEALLSMMQQSFLSMRAELQEMRLLVRNTNRNLHVRLDPLAYLGGGPVREMLEHDATARIEEEGRELMQTTEQRVGQMVWEVLSGPAKKAAGKEAVEGLTEGTQRLLGKDVLGLFGEDES